jgi:hypothetical protein
MRSCGFIRDVEGKGEVTLQHTVKAQKKIEVQLYPFFNFDTSWGLVVKAAALQPYSNETDSLPILQEDGWEFGPVWTGTENVAPIGVDPRTFQPVASRCIDYIIIREVPTSTLG